MDLWDLGSNSKKSTFCPILPAFLGGLVPFLNCCHGEIDDLGCCHAGVCCHAILLGVPCSFFFRPQAQMWKCMSSTYPSWWGGAASSVGLWALELLSWVAEVACCCTVCLVSVLLYFCKNLWVANICFLFHALQSLCDFLMFLLHKLCQYITAKIILGKCYKFCS